MATTAPHQATARPGEVSRETFVTASSVAFTTFTAWAMPAFR